MTLSLGQSPRVDSEGPSWPVSRQQTTPLALSRVSDQTSGVTESTSHQGHSLATGCPRLGFVPLPNASGDLGEPPFSADNGGGWHLGHSSGSPGRSRAARIPTGCPNSTKLPPATTLSPAVTCRTVGPGLGLHWSPGGQKLRLWPGSATLGPWTQGQLRTKLQRGVFPFPDSAKGK